MLISSTILTGAIQWNGFKCIQTKLSIYYHLIIIFNVFIIGQNSGISGALIQNRFLHRNLITKLTDLNINDIENQIPDNNNSRRDNFLIYHTNKGKY